MDIFEAYPATPENPNGFSREPIPEIDNYMSYSRIKTMSESMAHYERRYIKGIKPEDTPEKEFGRLVHKMILEPEKFLGNYTIHPHKSDYSDLIDTVADLKCALDKEKIRYTSKDKKATLEDMLAAHDDLYRGQIFRFIIENYENGLTGDEIRFTGGQVDQIASMILAIDNKVIGAKRARDLLNKGIPEICAYWQDEELGVTWFIRIDYLKVIKVGDQHLFWITDLKTTKDASFEGFKKEIARWGYHFQSWIYHRVVSGITGCKVNLTNIAVEKTEPIGVGVYESDDRAKDTAGWQIRNLLRQWRECQAMGRWPKYEEKIIKTGPPNWYHWNVEEKAELEGES